MSSSNNLDKRSGGSWRANAQPVARTFRPSGSALQMPAISRCPSPGEILFLGREDTVPMASVFRQRMKPSDGNPWSHPVVVISVKASAETVTFLPMTSVDLFERVKNPTWAMRYVPIHHPRHLTPRMRSTSPTAPFTEHPTASQPILHLEGEQRMKKPTSINVETAFEIEWTYLQPCPGHSKRLDRTSMDDLLRVKANYQRSADIRAQGLERRDSLEPLPVPLALASTSPSLPPLFLPQHTRTPSLSPSSTPELAIATPAVPASKVAYVPPFRRGGARARART